MDEDPGVDESGKPNKHNPSMSRLIAIEGVGETVARLLLEGLATRSEIVAELSEQFDITEESLKRDAGPLQGQTFCIKGTLHRPSEDYAPLLKPDRKRVVEGISVDLRAGCIVT